MKKLLLISCLLATCTAYAAEVDLEWNTTIRCPGLVPPYYAFNIWSDHTVKISNNSDEQRSFSVNFVLCEDGGKCERRHYDAVVPAHKVWDNRTITLHKRAFYPFGGRYEARAESTVDGKGLENRMQTANRKFRVK